MIDQVIHSEKFGVPDGVINCSYPKTNDWSKNKYKSYFNESLILSNWPNYKDFKKFNKNDLFRLDFSLPLSIEKGTADLEFISGRDYFGKYTSDILRVDLAPAHRERVISVSYSASVNTFSEFGLKLLLIENLNNIKKESQDNLTFFFRLKIN